LKIVKSRKYSLKLFCKIPDVDLVDSLYCENSIKLLSWFSDQFVRKSDYNNRDNFILSPCETLKQICGKHYKRYSSDLEDRYIIFPKILPNGLRYDYESGIATSYRLNFNCVRAINKKKFKLFPIEYEYCYPKPRTGRWRLTKNSIKNEKSLKILQNYRGISIEPEWLSEFQKDSFYPANHHKYPDQPVAQHALFLHAACFVGFIQRKTIPVTSESKSGRMFHPLLELTKLVRPYARIDGEKLVNIDAVCFHPFLVASCIENEADRSRYLDCVRKDFYERFEDSNYSRSKVKVSYQKFLSGKPTDSKSKEIRKWYEDRFPEVILKMKELKQNKTTFQMYLQKLESSIFVDAVFMQADFWCLPMHDGLCVLQKDENQAKDLINSAFVQKLGYTIPLD
jgi:hypothetical protein